jgi:tryptophan-rich sensory protein
MFNNNLLYHIFIPILLAIFMNGIIYTFRINKTTKEEESKYIYYKKFLPPGYIIGTIWVIIFGLLGYAHYLVFNQNQNKITISSLSIILVIIYCLLYPLITGLKVKSGLLLNLISLILAFSLGIIIILESKYIFLFILPLIIWSSYVNVIDTIQCSSM